MDQHGAVQPLERTAVGHIHLAAGCLLGGGADDQHRAAGLRDDGLGGQASGGGCGPDDVVTAAVADAGESIVFRQESHLWLAFTVRGAEGCGYLTDAPLDGKLLRLQAAGQPGGGLLLLEGGLRVGVELQAEGDELVAAAVDLGDHTLLEPVAVRHERTVLSR